MMRKSLICMAEILVILLFSSSVTYANAPRPPTELWFMFDYQVSPPPKLEGVQLVRCDTGACEKPVLLQQYGVCDAPVCLESRPELTGLGDPSDCQGGRCRFASPEYGYAFKMDDDVYFRLVAQFSDRARVSNVAAESLQSLNAIGAVSAWRVTVQDDGLSMARDTDFRQPGGRNASFLFWFAVTLVVELLVARLCLWMWKRGERVTGELVVVLLVSLVTFPVVWWFFPSLGQFQPDSARKVGILVLILALFYAVGLVRIYTVQGKNRLWAIGLYLLISFVVGFILFVLAYFGFGYGNYTVHAVGLPPGIILLLSEAFAVLAEAGLIALMSRKTLSLWQVGLMSLLMNAASCGVGLLAVGLWWVY